MMLDPERYWHVTESVMDEVVGQFSRRYEAKYECVDSKASFPIIFRSKSKSNGKDEADGKIHAFETEVIWTCREEDSVPEKEFKLPAFGLPEPDEKGDASLRGSGSFTPVADERRPPQPPSGGFPR